jgi:hypothetical protein
VIVHVLRLNRRHVPKIAASGVVNLVGLMLLHDSGAAGHAGQPKSIVLEPNRFGQQKR